MKNGYRLLTVLFALAWSCSYIKLVMARHVSHHHHFQENCFKCPTGYGVTRRCSTYYDTICSPCKPGHYSSHNSARRPCYPCSLCGVGLYVARPCSTTKDTMCDSCHTYKGVHNADFYERCVKPLRAKNLSISSTERNFLGSANASPLESSSGKDSARGFPHFVFIPAIMVICGLAMSLIIALLAAANSRWLSKTPNFKYPYQAVATQEAVLL